MSANYLEDVKRFSPTASDKAVAGIVKHLGIALKSNDASTVSCSSKDELATVREKWLKKKLALTEDDATLDKAIAAVCQTMKADTKKSRVTFYYLLAEKYGKLGLLGG
jgi:phage host-nuclease inhibitor protein Gam